MFTQSSKNLGNSELEKLKKYYFELTFTFTFKFIVWKCPEKSLSGTNKTNTKGKKVTFKEKNKYTKNNWCNWTYEIHFLN